jgi:hypothetical protein
MLMHHLQLYCHSVLWISIVAHALDLYFRFQVSGTVIGHMTPSPIMLIKHT